METIVHNSDYKIERISPQSGTKNKTKEKTGEQESERNKELRKYYYLSNVREKKNQWVWTIYELPSVAYTFIGRSLLNPIYFYLSFFSLCCSFSYTFYYRRHCRLNLEFGLRFYYRTNETNRNRRRDENCCNRMGKIVLLKALPKNYRKFPIFTSTTEPKKDESKTPWICRICYCIYVAIFLVKSGVIPFFRQRKIEGDNF